MNLRSINDVISNTFNRVASNPHELEHLLKLDSELPDINFIICDNSPRPYQVFDQYYFNNNFRINRHNVVIPKSVLDTIHNNGFYTGCSALEYQDYAGVSPLRMKRSEFITALAVHELSHVFQLYIQDYVTDEDHTEEFYDVLESFYDSPFIQQLNSGLSFVNKGW